MSDDTRLSPERFGEFYKELYPERVPYRWHERAARELADGDAWEDAAIWSSLSAPTGAGKTTLIECFLFALACTQARSPFPRRLFWVVDRRSVVDQIYRHALQVNQLISAAQAGSLAADVRDRLVKLAGKPPTDRPVQVRLWRGGLDGAAAFDGRWTADRADSQTHDTTRSETRDVAAGLSAPLSPIAAAVICSTVDQIGSRLLFRGYGVSPRARPFEAALVGTDSLIVLDEAHLSGPFEETAHAVAEMQKDTPAQRPGVQVMSVTATPAGRASAIPGRPAPIRVFELTDDEREDPALEARQSAKRLVTLQRARSQVLACTTAARECADGGSKVIGVVANTVGAARRIATALRSHGDVVLIIGPARRLDREHLLDRIPERDAREQLDQPLYVVGTQTLEVGLDLDFDALVTECAPLRSLVQRFGRLDRAGELTARGTPGRGVIVEPSTSFSLYGDATAATWTLLSERAKLGPLGFSAEQTAELLADASQDEHVNDEPRAPLLCPWHVELLAQTSYPNRPEPYVPAFLRGEKALDATDVQICWRADLKGDSGLEATRQSWITRVEARLPHPGELLSLPPWTAKRWLAGHQAIGDVADIEGIADEDDRSETQQEDRILIRVPPPEQDGNVEPKAISPSELRPGDVIVLPAGDGGCDEYGWDPRSHAPVSDLGNLSLARPRVLLSASIGTPDDLLASVEETVRRLAREELSEQDAYEQLIDGTREWLRSMSESNGPKTPAQKAAEWLSEKIPDKGRIVNLGEQDGEPAEVVLLPQRKRHKGERAAAVSYQDHANAVEVRVEAFAEGLELEDLTPTLVSAARHHDVGKLDRRFQAWLNGGFPSNPGEPLAKSERGPGTPLFWVARRNAGWPRHKRHEAISAALLNAVTSWPANVDRDLLLYLVATHHGDGRPSRSFVADDEPVRVTAEIDGSEVSVSSDAEIPWAEHGHRFDALNKRFGVWGLAAIESLLVLADRSVSAEGS